MYYKSLCLRECQWSLCISGMRIRVQRVELLLLGFCRVGIILANFSLQGSEIELLRSFSAKKIAKKHFHFGTHEPVCKLMIWLASLNSSGPITVFIRTSLRIPKWVLNIATNLGTSQQCLELYSEKLYFCKTVIRDSHFSHLDPVRHWPNGL